MHLLVGLHFYYLPLLLSVLPLYVGCLATKSAVCFSGKIESSDGSDCEDYWLLGCGAM
jgi:hypothetical protein